MMQTLLQDIRFGCRMLMRNPGFTIAALLCLGLGIGATTSIFSVVNAVLLRPLPYKDPDRLVMVMHVPAKSISKLRYFGHCMGVSLPWKGQLRSFESMAFFAPQGEILTDKDGSELIPGMAVDEDFFKTLGQQVIVGRTFLKEEYTTGDHAVIILSHSLWQRRYNSDKSIIGKTVFLEKKPRVVVGIMAPDIRSLVYSNEGQKIDKPVDFWIPPEKDLHLVRQDDGVWDLVARLKPGVDLKQAQAEMDLVAENLAKSSPATRGKRFVVMPLLTRMVGDFQPILLLLFGATSFVLLIACANVASLMLIRVLSRQHEFMVRVALGASRLCLVRQLLTEGLLLALPGGGLGILLAIWGTEGLAASAQAYMPRLHGVNLDHRVLGFSIGLSLITGLAVGGASVIRIFGMNVSKSLREIGRSSTATRSHQRIIRLIVVSEIALALILLTGAGLMIRSLSLLTHVETGFNGDRVLTMGIVLPEMDTQFALRLLERVKSLPGIEKSAITNGFPLHPGGGCCNIFISGRASSGEDTTPVFFSSFSPDYFRVMGIPLVRGRIPDERDASATLVVINEMTAKHFWPNEDPIGKRFQGGCMPTEHEIVGIVKDTAYKSLDAGAAPQAYLLYPDGVVWNISVLLKTKGDPLSYVTPVRNEVLSLDKNAVVRETYTMSQIVANTVAERRFVVFLLSIFAMIGLLLAIIGIYGVMANSVAQRTHDIGVRIAMGAQRRDIIRMVVGQGLVLIGIGVGIGLAGAFALTRLIASQLYGVKATDPWTFAGVTILLAAVALAACYIPARRATKIDPMEVLRWE